MSTTVLIGTQGDRVVLVRSAAGVYRVQPGRWFTVELSEGQPLEIAEVGELVQASSLPVHTPFDKEQRRRLEATLGPDAVDRRLKPWP